jgi:hypothetical protein
MARWWVFKVKTARWISRSGSRSALGRSPSRRPETRRSTSRTVFPSLALSQSPSVWGVATRTSSRVADHDRRPSTRAARIAGSCSRASATIALSLAILGRYPRRRSTYSAKEAIPKWRWSRARWASNSQRSSSSSRAPWRAASSRITWSISRGVRGHSSLLRNMGLTITRRSPSAPSRDVANRDPPSPWTHALGAQSILTDRSSKTQDDRRFVDRSGRAGPRFLSRAFVLRNGSSALERNSHGTRPRRGQIHLGRNHPRVHRTDPAAHATTHRCDPTGRQVCAISHEGTFIEGEYDGHGRGTWPKHERAMTRSTAMRRSSSSPRSRPRWARR